MGLEMFWGKRAEKLDMKAPDDGVVTGPVLHVTIPEGHDYSDGLENGAFYKVKDLNCSDIGPRDYYLDWLEWLAGLGSYVSSEAPFAELLDYLEGPTTIGYKTSRKLAKDFLEAREAAERSGETDFYETFLAFQGAFQDASKEGLVVFC